AGAGAAARAEPGVGLRPSRGGRHGDLAGRRLPQPALLRLGGMARDVGLHAASEAAEGDRGDRHDPGRVARRGSPGAVHHADLSRRRRRDAGEAAAVKNKESRMKNKEVVPPCSPPRRGRRGVALIIVLWVMAILTLLMYAFLGEMQVEYAVAGGYADGKKAEQLAWSAIDLACATVMNDTQRWQSLNDTTWANNPDNFYEYPLGDGSFTLFRPVYDDAQTILWGLDDEASKINLNTAPKELLMKLPNMTEEIADAILDWRDTDSTPGASGAESAYYNSLNPPYNCKSQPFETVEELLYVRGITPEILYGEDFNLNGRLEPNENDGDQTWPRDNRDGKLNPGLWQLCTVWSSDANMDADGKNRANLNTAPTSSFRRRVSSPPRSRR